VFPLSPSRAADFKACPQLFKFRAIDKLPEPPDPRRARGTLVHGVLERLCRLPGEERTMDAARRLIEEVWAEVGDGEDPLWLREAEGLLSNYFRLEDPAAVRVHDVEARVSHESERTALRGIVDRIELLGNDDDWVLADYKTGRPPSHHGALGAFFGLKFYALLCWRAFGKMPSELRLIQLGEPEVLTLRPDRQMLEGLERQLEALSRAVGRAIATGDWRPRPGHLCRVCPHRSVCPAWAGSGSPEAGAGTDERVGDPLGIDRRDEPVPREDRQVAQRKEPLTDRSQLLAGVPAGQVGSSNGAGEERVA
jgi:putative RecB family exonuclease